MVRFFAIAVGSLALAYAAGVNAFTTWGGRFMPATMLKIDASSPYALTAVNESAWQEKDKRNFKRVARTNALEVLRREPLAYRALRQLGLYYVLAGDPGKGRELVKLSAKMTRRDATGQMWLAEDYARMKQIDQALRAFDIVIRTEPDTREVAFQAMGAALADTKFRKSFVRLASTNPPWLPEFLAFNIGTTQRVSELAQAIRELQPLPKAALPEKEAGALLTRLVALAPIEEARSFYLSLPGSRAPLLTSLNYKSAKEAFLYPPFGWEVFDNAGVQAFGSGQGQNAMIEAIVLPGYRGTASRKLFFLPQGAHRWSGTTDLTQMAPGAAATISLSCYRAPGKWSRVSEFPLHGGANRIDFQVPGDCRAQLLSLDLVGADNQTDSAMTIALMQLSRPSGS